MLCVGISSSKRTCLGIFSAPVNRRQYHDSSRPQSWTELRRNHQERTDLFTPGRSIHRDGRRRRQRGLRGGRRARFRCAGGAVGAIAFPHQIDGSGLSSVPGSDLVPVHKKSGKRSKSAASGDRSAESATSSYRTGCVSIRPAYYADESDRSPFLPGHLYRGSAT